MASYERTAAVVAVLVVLATAGAGFLTTGGATASADPYDFYIKSVTYPKIIYPNTLTATKSVVGNTGTQSAAFIYYKYQIWEIDDYSGLPRAKVFESGDDTYIHTLPANSKDLSRSLSSLMFPHSGKYKVRVELNWDKNRGYEEKDKSDNVFETTVEVQKTG